MKKGILLLLLFSSAFVQAQTLKDALYGGKLKNQPGSVIRKGDDLASKMDTTRKVAATDTALTKVTTTATVDSPAKKPATPANSAVLPGRDKVDSVQVETNTEEVTEAADAPKENVAAPKSNNAIFKEYVTSISNTLKTEVLPNKKIKKGTYYVLVSYTIDTVGQVTIGDVSVSPDNALLQQQIKDRLSIDTPRLSPVLSGSGIPRKSNKRYSFTLEK